MRRLEIEIDSEKSAPALSRLLVFFRQTTKCMRSGHFSHNY